MTQLVDSQGAERLAPFLQAGVLASIDLHVVTLLGARAGVDEGDVLLALALAARAPRMGHICVDLGEVQADDLRPEAGFDESEPIALTLPGDRAGWTAAVGAAEALVRVPTDDRVTPFVLDGGLLYADRYWRYQDRMATSLADWATEVVPLGDAGKEQVAAGLDHLFRPPSGPDVGINLQRVAGAMALLRRFAVITGGPGMGKTWTVRNLLALLWLRHRARRGLNPELPEHPVVALAAPTGKAAARMREALRANLQGELLDALGEVDPSGVGPFREWLVGLEARTLHRLLGYRSDNPSRFRHHADNPLPHDIVVVDEASMVDFAMMAKLVDAVGSDGPSGEPTRLVLLGDRHQLASVEAGSVLADLVGPTEAETLRFTPSFLDQLAALHPLVDVRARPDLATGVQAVDGPSMHDAVVQFNRTFRFAADSGIGRFAKACISRGFSSSTATDLLVGGAGDGSADVTVLAHGADGGLGKEAAQVILDGYRPYLAMLRRGFQATDDCPDVEAWHRMLLDAFDRFRVLCALRRGRSGVAGVNDSVVAMLRDVGLVSGRATFWTGRPILVRRNDYGVRRSSGGKGLFNGDVGLVVQAPDGRRMVVFPGVDSPGSGIESARLVDYVDPARLPEHDTVFAMTIHKSQGSEFDHAMIVLPDHDSPILTRELIYTGVTRARQRVTLVGERDRLETALEAQVKRASGLAGRLWG